MQKLSGMAAQLLGSDADAPAETAAPPRGTDAARIQLLHALRPFLSENTRAQIAHAERILSLARMTKTGSEFPETYCGNFPGKTDVQQIRLPGR